MLPNDQIATRCLAHEAMIVALGDRVDALESSLKAHEDRLKKLEDKLFG